MKKEKNYFLCSYFRHISLCFYSNFEWESSMDAEFFLIQRVTTLHTFDGPHYPKKRNTWKNVMMTSSSHFSGIYFFWGSGVCQKYAVWVLVGCIIKFRIQRALLIKIWVKTQGDVSKIQTKKVIFLWYLSPNLY